jgi:hypothetical protein
VKDEYLFEMSFLSIRGTLVIWCTAFLRCVWVGSCCVTRDYTILILLVTNCTSFYIILTGPLKL